MDAQIRWQLSHHSPSDTVEDCIKYLQAFHASCQSEQ